MHRSLAALTVALAAGSQPLCNALQIRGRTKRTMTPAEMAARNARAAPMPAPSPRPAGRALLEGNLGEEPESPVSMINEDELLGEGESMSKKRKLDMEAEEATMRALAEYKAKGKNPHLIQNLRSNALPAAGKSVQQQDEKMQPPPAKKRRREATQPESEERPRLHQERVEEGEEKKKVSEKPQMRRQLTASCDVEGSDAWPLCAAVKSDVEPVVEQLSEQAVRKQLEPVVAALSEAAFGKNHVAFFEALERVRDVRNEVFRRADYKALGNFLHTNHSALTEQRHKENIDKSGSSGHIRYQTSGNVKGQKLDCADYKLKLLQMGGGEPRVVGLRSYDAAKMVVENDETEHRNISGENGLDHFVISPLTRVGDLRKAALAELRKTDPETLSVEFFARPQAEEHSDDEGNNDENDEKEGAPLGDDELLGNLGLKSVRSSFPTLELFMLPKQEETLNLQEHLWESIKHRGEWQERVENSFEYFLLKAMKNAKQQIIYEDIPEQIQALWTSVDAAAGSTSAHACTAFIPVARRTKISKRWMEEAEECSDEEEEEEDAEHRGAPDTAVDPRYEMHPGRSFCVNGTEEEVVWQEWLDGKNKYLSLLQFYPEQVKHLVERVMANDGGELAQSAGSGKVLLEYKGWERVRKVLRRNPKAYMMAAKSSYYVLHELTKNELEASKYTKLDLSNLPSSVNELSVRETKTKGEIEMSCMSAGGMTSNLRMSPGKKVADVKSGYDLFPKLVNVQTVKVSLYNMFVTDLKELFAGLLSFPKLQRLELELDANVWERKYDYERNGEDYLPEWYWDGHGPHAKEYEHRNKDWALREYWETYGGETIQTNQSKITDSILYRNFEAECAERGIEIVTITDSEERQKLWGSEERGWDEEEDLTDTLNRLVVPDVPVAHELGVYEGVEPMKFGMATCSRNWLAKVRQNLAGDDEIEFIEEANAFALKGKRHLRDRFIRATMNLEGGLKKEANCGTDSSPSESERDSDELIEESGESGNEDGASEDQSERSSENNDY